jgi:type VI secretion system secreted protein VgrG
MAEQQTFIRIITSLGENKFVLREMHVAEALGQPFVIDLTADSDDADIDFKQILGDHLTVEFDIGSDEHRYFDGIVVSFAYIGMQEYRASYKLVLHPWLWLLTRRFDCKIFQGKTAPQIIKEIFQSANFDDFEDKLQRSDYLSYDYCVQYRESDFAFVSRLMEKEGIYYYFKHDKGVHKLVLCDGATAHGKYADKYGDIKFARSEDDTETGSVWEWTWGHELQSGQYTHTDYDLEKPNADLKKSKSTAQGHKQDSFEIYDYPGRYTDSNDGTTYADIHMEEQVAQFERASGKSRTRWIATGCLLTLKDSLRKNQSGEYLVIETRSSVSADAGTGSQMRFETEFHAQGTAQVYRSPRRTPKPFIRGPQTAFVVGKSGEEIWTDKYGRVKVQFHWDRDGQNDEKSSCWVRCAQAWASKNWGAMFIPRIGQEVIVHFLEGDPDQPIITGAVYNASSMPPYDLPGNATRSTVKSNSSKGGNGFNEIRFEDKAGSEEFYMHAQKDMTIDVINNRSITVEQGDETKQIQQGKQTTTVQGDTSLTVQQGNHSITVSTGSASMTVTQGITIQSDMSITLQVANNSITIDPTGVTINGTMISLTGTATTQVTGLATTVEGSAMLELSGGVLMVG